MFGSFGVPELLILLLIIIIVFGVGRLPELGGALGKSIREFREAVSGEEEKKAITKEETSSEEEK